jgi:hypothetical protein
VLKSRLPRFLKNVWVKKGYGVIDFGKAQFGNGCPSCNKKMKSPSFEGFGFMNAKVQFEGARFMNGSE